MESPLSLPCSACFCFGLLEAHLDWSWLFWAWAFGSACSTWGISNLERSPALDVGRWINRKSLSIISRSAAPEELKVARDYEQVRRFDRGPSAADDLDGSSKLITCLATCQRWVIGIAGSGKHFPLAQPGLRNLNSSAVWTIALCLLSSSNRARGTLMVYRQYSRRDLQVDVNLLTNVFPTALADALDRTLAHPAEIICTSRTRWLLLPAQAG